VVFSDADSLAPLYVPIHPTQAYHSLAGLTTFIVLMALKKPLRDQPGRLMGVFLLLYPAFRFTIEFFRGDFRGHVLEVFSTTQVIAACLFCLGLWLVLRRTGEANDA
jgi:phosphatidylglycerol:prolipoprotein diacylglycerol transferase